MDINRWKRRLQDKIVTREMIDNMYIKKKISLKDYLYIVDQEETTLIQEESVTLSEKIENLIEENKALKERINNFEGLVQEMNIMLNNTLLRQ